MENSDNQDNVLKTFGPLELVCVPFDESGPPTSCTSGYSGIRGERLLMKRVINGQEQVVELKKGPPALCRAMMCEVGRILLFTSHWTTPIPKEEPWGPGRP